jgi:hypothetical protein
MAGIAMVCTYLLARRFVGTGSATLVVLLVLLFPGVARETPSFTTDIPAFALMMLCLLLGATWLDGGEERGTFASSMAAGVLAVSIREFAIAAPAAVLVVAWARSVRGQRAWLFVATALSVASVVSVVVVANSIPGREGSTPAIFGFLLIGPIFATLAAALLPALFLGLGRRSETLSSTSILIGAGFACALAVIPWGGGTGNMWMQIGFAGDLLLNGRRAEIFDEGVWVFSRQVAAFAAILLAAAIAVWSSRRLHTPRQLIGRDSFATRIVERHDAVLVMFLVAFGIEIVVFAPFWIYDRYLIPIVPVAAILLLQGVPEQARLGRSLALAHGALAWLAFSAFVIAANSFAYDGARWREGSAAASLGYTAQRVDAGYEWVGYHAGGLPKAGAPADNMTWTNGRWALMDPCVVISNTEIGDSTYTLIYLDPDAYLSYLFLGEPESLYLYATSSPGCPTSPTNGDG